MALEKASTNPWDIQSIYDLQFFNCPACVYKDVSKENFVYHAYENHSDSTTYLAIISDGSLDDIHCPWRLNIEIKDDIADEAFPLDESEVMEHFDSVTNAEPDDSNIKPPEEIDTSLDEKEKIDFEAEGTAICNQCGKAFLNRKYLISHISEEHSTGHIKCASCIHTFKTMPELEKHFEANHSNVNILKCKLCNEGFQNYHKLARHKEVVHKIFPKMNRASKCNDCLMPFNTFPTQELHDENCQTLQQKICDSCGQQFEDLAELKQHRNQTHITMFECEFCKKPFSYEKTLNQHMKKFHSTEYENAKNMKEAELAKPDQELNTESSNCNQCGISFETNRLLINHISEEHSGNCLKCAGCDQTFKTLAELEVHFESEHRESPNEKKTTEAMKKCNLCDEEFSSHYKLSKHKKDLHSSDSSESDRKKSPSKKNSSEANVKCQYCEEKFTNYYFLYKHKDQEHSSEIVPKKVKPDRCKECLMDLDSFKSPQLHEENCKTLQERICEYCGVQFKALSQLRDHRGEVHNLGMLKCSDCDKLFASENRLKTHAKNSHVTEECKCDICHARFHKRKTMTHHMVKNHRGMKVVMSEDGTKLFQCSHCNEEYTEVEPLDDHLNLEHKDLKINPRSRCHRCEESFDTEELRKEHSKNCEAIFTCHICGTTMTNKRSLVTHIKSIHQKIRRAKCHKCGKEFYEKNRMVQHIQNVHDGQKNFQCHTCGTDFSSKS